MTRPGSRKTASASPSRRTARLRSSVPRHRRQRWCRIHIRKGFLRLADDTDGHPDRPGFRCEPVRLLRVDIRKLRNRRSLRNEFRSRSGLRLFRRRFRMVVHTHCDDSRAIRNHWRLRLFCRNIRHRYRTRGDRRARGRDRCPCVHRRRSDWPAGSTRNLTGDFGGSFGFSVAIYGYTAIVGSPSNGGSGFAWI